MTTDRKNALMILGTASHVGKSILTAGLGRILSDDGYRVAPFKAQNMSLNSAATLDGGEIGPGASAASGSLPGYSARRDESCFTQTSTDTGRAGNFAGKNLGPGDGVGLSHAACRTALPEVLAAYRRLVATHELIVLEGAGSPAEINLREHDIVNMRMAHAADAACVLVGDIDRGGVFASLLGTLELLEPADRARIRGFIVNKFRGDESLLRPGVAMIEKRLGLPCVGVVPFLHDLGLDEEDGVALEDRASAARRWKIRSRIARALRVGVIALPHMANFTDFDALALEPSISLAFLEAPEEMAAADLLILPGTKQTLDDLRWLERGGFAQELRRLTERCPDRRHLRRLSDAWSFHR
jgi:adenosylcobyric acid synthase